MIKFFLIIYSIIGIIITVAVTMKSAKRSGKIISILSLINLIYIMDVCLPAILVIYDGEKEIPPYMGYISIESYYIAVLLHSLAIVLFWGFYFRKKNIYYQKKPLYLTTKQMKKAERLLCCLIFILILGLINDINASGGIINYYNFKIARIYAVAISYPNVLRKIFNLICEVLLTPAMILSAFYIIKGDKNIKKIVYFSVVFFFVLISFYRGTMINYFFMLLILYEEKELKFNKKLRKIFSAGIIIVLAFFFYGGIRSVLTRQYWGTTDNGMGVIASAVELIKYTLGNTLLGTARCVQYITEGNPPFMGLSIFELLYRFIPRAIWKTKPKLYGMQTISMAMGTPESTMDALSLLGELIVNFSWTGILLIPIYGCLAKKFEELRNDTLTCILYAAMLFPLCTMSMWMGNTGMMTNILNMIMYYLLLKFIIRKRKLKISD